MRPFEIVSCRRAAGRRGPDRVSANLLSYGDYGPRARGHYGTPDDDGPQYGSGGDQFRYGPAYSYARQAPGRWHGH